MKSNNHQAILIADLGYGDAGKGSIVDYLTRTTGAHTVVRYNGGAQAAHNVITPDGRHHTFAQFGSGTFFPGTRTHLSRFMMVHPLALLAEERHLHSLGIQDAFARLSIDRKALVTTPFQQAANRIKELARGDGRHGSCGMGVGETMSDWLSYGDEVLFAGDMCTRDSVIRKLKRMREIKLSQLVPVLQAVPDIESINREMESFKDDAFIEATADVYLHVTRQANIVETDFLSHLLNQPGTIIFEGAQGVLLDEWYGFYPYNTWSTLTFKNADILLSENGFDGESLKLGLIRGYATRHGAGPFVTEEAWLTEQLQDSHNGNNPWQKEFRVGYLDLVTLRYALNVAGKVDGLVVTNLDRMSEMPEWLICNRYLPNEMTDQTKGYFATDGNLIHDINVPPDPTDLTKQEVLTKMLFNMQPVYKNCKMDINSYLEVISQCLGETVLLTSCGPKPDKKDWINHGMTKLALPTAYQTACTETGQAIIRVKAIVN